MLRSPVLLLRTKFVLNNTKRVHNLYHCMQKIDANKVPERCWHLNAQMFSWDSTMIITIVYYHIGYYNIGFVKVILM